MYNSLSPKLYAPARYGDSVAVEEYADVLDNDSPCVQVIVGMSGVLMSPDQADHLAQLLSSFAQSIRDAHIEMGGKR